MDWELVKSVRGLSEQSRTNRVHWPSLDPQLLLRSRQTAVDARTEDGTTALMLAARLAVEDLVEELIAAQADVGARDKWGTDLERLVLCCGEVAQMECERRCKKRKQQRVQLQTGGGGGVPSHLAMRVVNLQCDVSMESTL